MFIDCKYQALLPVISYFGRDVAYFLYDICFFYNYIPIEGISSFHVGIARNKSRKEKLKDIGILQKDYYGYYNIVEAIIQAINNETPIIIRVDLYYDKDAMAYYQKTHWAHYLLIYGYDYVKKQFLVYDSINGIDYHYVVKTKSFQAVSEAYAGFVNFFLTIKKPSFMTFNSMGSNLKKPDISVLLKEMHLMYRPMIEISINAVQWFNEDTLKLLKGNKDVVDLKSAIDKLSKLCLSKRAIQYLQGIAGFYMLNDMAKATALNDNLLQDYMMLRAVMTKYYYSGNLNQHSKQNIICRMRNIEENEQRFHLLMRQ